MKKMKLIVIFFIVFCMFFSTKNVLAADNKVKMKIIDGPGWFHTGLQKIDISVAQVLKDGTYVCPNVWLSWTETKFIWTSRSYELSITEPANYNRLALQATNSASDSTKELSCHYDYNDSSGEIPHIEFEISYKASENEKKVKETCNYEWSNAYNDVAYKNTKVSFVIYEDGTVGNETFTPGTGNVNWNMNWKFDKDSQPISACPEYLVDKYLDRTTFKPATASEVTTDFYYKYTGQILDPSEADGIAIYVKSTTSNIKIVVNSAGGGYSYTLYDYKSNSTSDITSKVKNPDGLSTSFGGDNSGAPTYLVFDKNEDSYTFQNKTSFGADNYILLDKINQLYLEKGKDYENTCRALFGDSESGFSTFLNNNIFRVVYIAVPIILILLTSFDFAKAVFNSDSDGIQSAFKKFGKRIVAAVCIYLVPTIIIFASSLIGGSEVSQCARQLQNIDSEYNFGSN